MADYSGNLGRPAELTGTDGSVRWDGEEEVGDQLRIHGYVRFCGRFDLLGRLGHGLSVEFRYDEFASENSYPYFDLLTDWTTGQRAEFTSFERARPSNLHLDPLLRTAIRCFAMTWLLRKSATRL